MGLRFSAPRRWLMASVAGGLLCFALAPGCQDKSNQVSSSLFMAPIATSSMIDVLADKLDFLRAINPNELDSVLQGFPAEGYCLGMLTEHDDADGSVREVDEFLVYETQTRSLLSASLTRFHDVDLNYNTAGLDEEQSSQGGVTAGGSISTTVPSIRLKNGWILSYDSSAQNLVAFRKEAPRTVEIDGVPTELAFRNFPQRPLATNKNFGVGKGLVLSLVISGQDLAIQARTPSPIVTRFYELEENKILLFFSTVRAIHLLELEEETVDIAWDLNEPSDPDKRLPTNLLRGTIKLFPSNPLDPESPATAPFLAFTRISSTITGNPDVKVDTFQPIAVPLSATSRPALIFERTTSQFIHVFAVKQNDEIVGSAATRAILSDVIFSTLQQGTGGNVVSPPLDFRRAFYFQGSPAICLFEEKTNNCLSYWYGDPITDNLDVFVQAGSILQPRVPGGGTTGIAPTEPVLIFAEDDVDANRLAFDGGQDQLLSINYPTGAVVVAADRQTITTRTGASLADFTFIEPVTDTDIRAFDTAAMAVLKIGLQYNAFPITIE